MRWVVWLGVLYEFIVFCILLCDGVLDVCGYVHSYPFVGHSDVYGATKDAGVGGCMEVDETFGEVGDFIKICVCILNLWGAVWV